MWPFLFIFFKEKEICIWSVHCSYVPEDDCFKDFWTVLPIAAELDLLDCDVVIIS